VLSEQGKAPINAHKVASGKFPSQPKAESVTVYINNATKEHGAFEEGLVGAC